MIVTCFVSIISVYTSFEENYYCKNTEKSYTYPVIYFQMKQRNGILFLCMKITMYKRGAQGKTQKIGMCMYTARKMKEEMK